MGRGLSLCEARVAKGVSGVHGGWTDEALVNIVFESRIESIIVIAHANPDPSLLAFVLSLHIPILYKAMGLPQGQGGGHATDGCPWSLLLLLLLRWPPRTLDVVVVLERHTLGHVVDLVYADEARG